MDLGIYLQNRRNGWLLFPAPSGERHGNDWSKTEKEGGRERKKEREREGERDREGGRGREREREREQLHVWPVNQPLWYE